MTKGIFTHSILLLLLSSLHLSAQCSIDDFTVSISDCQDGNTVDITVDFNTDVPSNIGYQVVTTTGFTIVQINEFPYTFALDGNCVTDYNVGIVDLSITDCEVTQNIGVICCDIMCALDVNIINLQCSENQSIIASLEVNLTGSLADSVDIYTNDNLITTTALSKLVSIELPSLGPVQNLVVCEQGTMCCDTLDINDPCYCNIFDIHAAVTDCDPFMDSYFLRIDFETTSPSSDSFNIGRPGNALGTHAYADLPIRVGAIEFTDGDGDIFILDQSDAFCFGFIPHITLDSCDAISCELTDLEITSTIDCDTSDDVTFNVSFNTSVESEGFQILIDGQSFGPFQYGQNGYSIGPLPSNGMSTSIVEIIDLSDPSCTISAMVSPISCDCSYDNLSVTQLCNEDVLISVLVDFEPNGAVTDSFDLVSTSFTTRYSYSQLPINITGLATEDISLEILDVQNPNCSLGISEQLKCALECKITNFEVEVLSCEALGIANLSFTFDSDDLTTDTVVLSYNGDVLGNYIVQDSGSYLIPFLEIDCELDFNTFSLTPINDLDCFADFAMPNIDCCTPCEVSNPVLIPTCFDDMSASLFIEFDYDGDSTDMFDLFILNDLFGTFSYDQIPLNITIDALAQGDYPYSIEFLLCDFEDTFAFDCSEECIVENIQLDTLSCSEGMFTALLDFDHSEANDSFTLIVNQDVDDTYALDDLPIEIGPYAGDGVTDYTFTISVVDFESCIGTFELGTLDCGPNAIDDQVANNIKWFTLPNGILLEGVAPFTQMTLIDINGRMIQQTAISEDQLFIDNTDRMNGLYFVRLQDEKGNTHSIKIIL